MEKDLKTLYADIFNVLSIFACIFGQEYVSYGGVVCCKKLVSIKIFSLNINLEFEIFNFS